MITVEQALEYLKNQKKIYFINEKYLDKGDKDRLILTEVLGIMDCNYNRSGYVARTRPIESNILILGEGNIEGPLEQYFVSKQNYIKTLIKKKQSEIDQLEIQEDDEEEE